MLKQAINLEILMRYSLTQINHITWWTPTSSSSHITDDDLVACDKDTSNTDNMTTEEISFSCLPYK